MGHARFARQRGGLALGRRVEQGERDRNPRGLRGPLDRLDGQPGSLAAARQPSVDQHADGPIGQGARAGMEEGGVDSTRRIPRLNAPTREIAAHPGGIGQDQIRRVDRAALFRRLLQHGVVDAESARRACGKEKCRVGRDHRVPPSHSDPSEREDVAPKRKPQRGVGIGEEDRDPMAATHPDIPQLQESPDSPIDAKVR